MSYSGNSKEQVVLNAVTNDQFSILNDRITTEKTFLMSMVNTEATNRNSADTNLNNLINVEKVAREETRELTALFKPIKKVFSSVIRVFKLLSPAILALTSS